MTPRTRPLPAAATAVAAGAAAVVLALCSPAVASESGGGPAGSDTTRPGDAVTLTPSYGASGATVSVRVRCAGEPEHGAVFSPAFAHAAALRPGPDGSMVTVATVRPGAASGRSDVVTANCSATESLTTTFVRTTPGSGPHAGAARSVRGADEAREAHVPVDPNQVDGVALAFGGGLAGAALAGYLLTARRAARRRAARRPSSADSWRTGRR
jgi:hypothetical protein